MAVSANDPDPGTDQPTRFGRYKVVRELGKGGMARVFEGRHDALGSRVALKVMQPALAAQPMAAGRFLREAKAASQIRHPNVAEVFDIGTENGLPFIVMEFLEGSNLAALLGEKGPLTVTGIVDVFLPVISAVATAHAAGIIHRDLKPANLMITRRPPFAVHPFVLDFGISKITSEELESTFTRSESLLGTVQYMAPELTKGAKFASPASDQYALGVMLYECATGQRPFAGASHYEVMHAIVTAPVVPPSRLRPALPREFDAIVERAMHRDATKRFPSVEALGSALLSFGDRTAWALWEREFTGRPRDGEPWAAAGQLTLDDGPSTGERIRKFAVPLAHDGTRSARRARWLLAPLAIYAVAVTVLLARSGWEKDAAAVAARAPETTNAAGLTAADKPAPGLTLERTSPRPVAIVADVADAPSEQSPNGTLERESLRAPAPQAAPRAISRSAATSPTSAASPSSRSAGSAAREAVTAAPARAARPEPTPTVVVGTNGAPIVD
jgi:eukaryotic-like serine/threonine-protein kinase